MLPKSIAIGPFTFKIRRSSPPFEFGNRVGLTDLEQVTIHLKPALVPEVEQSTLFHEICHAITIGVPALELKEEQVQFLEHALYGLLKRDKALRKYLFEELDDKN